MTKTAFPTGKNYMLIDLSVVTSMVPSHTCTKLQFLEEELHCTVVYTQIICFWGGGGGGGVHSPGDDFT